MKILNCFHRTKNESPFAHVLSDEDISDYDGSVLIKGQHATDVIRTSKEPVVNIAYLPQRSTRLPTYSPNEPASNIRLHSRGVGDSTPIHASHFTQTLSPNRNASQTSVHRPGAPFLFFPEKVASGNVPGYSTDSSPCSISRQHINPAPTLQICDSPSNTTSLERVGMRTPPSTLPQSLPPMKNPDDDALDDGSADSPGLG
jgi:hypothetical protein